MKTKLIDSQIEICPKCSSNWNDGDIFKKFRNNPSYKDKTDDEIVQIASNYGWSKENKRHFSRLIGVEIQGQYDGVSYWKCPDCKQMWDRFTGEEVDNIK